MPQLEPNANATLNNLIKLSRNSEEGFRVAAENINNRGLKTLLKAYAGQYAQLKQELKQEVQRLEGQLKERRSLLGTIHRGWITIKAAMTIERIRSERAVLHEVCRGQGYALKQYAKALNGSLPAETHQLVMQQQEIVQEIAQQAYNMADNQECRMVVRLFDDDVDVGRAEHALSAAGIEDEAISKMVFNTAVSQYDDQHTPRNTILETAAAGSLGGAVIGLVLGAVLGLTVLLIPDIEMNTFLSGDPARAVIILALLGSIIGAVFAAFVTLLIGLSTLEQDAYLYEDSVKHGQTLMMVFTEIGHAQEASDIMGQVNLARFSRS